METILLKTLQLILSLSILVIIHELEHFLFARLFKIRVEKFYLFFNPWFSLFKFKPKGSETEYGVGWLPLGGYVKIAGMIDESMDTEQLAQPEQPWEFRSKPAWQRLLVMIAGVVFNFVLAIMIYSAIAFTWGEKYVSLKDAKAGMEFSDVAKEIGFRDGDRVLMADQTELDRFDSETLRSVINAKEVTVQRGDSIFTIAMPADLMQRLMANGKIYFMSMNVPFVVKEVSKGSLAEAAGLQNSDSIVGVNGIMESSLLNIKAHLDANKGKEITLNFYRAGSLDSCRITPSAEGTIGVMLKNPEELFPVHTNHFTFWQSIPQGITMGVNKLTSYVSDMKYVFTKEGAKSLGGFATIGSIFPSTWDWEGFWTITAFLSVILAFMNILPIPALDGGHVLFLIWEVVTGKKPNEKFMEYAQTVGMILLLGLLLYANGQDIVRFLFK